MYLLKGNNFRINGTTTIQIAMGTKNRVAVASGKTNFDGQDWTNLSEDAPVLKPELSWGRD